MHCKLYGHVADLRWLKEKKNNAQTHVQIMCSLTTEINPCSIVIQLYNRIVHSLLTSELPDTSSAAHKLSHVVWKRVGMTLLVHTQFICGPYHHTFPFHLAAEVRRPNEYSSGTYECVNVIGLHFASPVRPVNSRQIQDGFVLKTGLECKKYYSKLI